MRNWRICPICGRYYEEYPAISRQDNRTEICPDCGVVEALACFVKFEERRKLKKKLIK